MAIDTLTNTLYVANSQAASNNIWQIDITTSQVTTIANVTSFPVQIDINPLNNRIYIAGDYVSVIDGNNNTVVTTFSLPSTGRPHGIIIDPLRDQLWVANYADPGIVNVINSNTHAIIGTITVGRNCSNIAGNLLTNRFYISNYSRDYVSVIDGNAPYAVIGTITAGTNQDSPAVNPFITLLRNSVQSNLVYVSIGASNNVAVIDQNTNKLLATIPVGNTPLWSVIDPFMS